MPQVVTDQPVTMRVGGNYTEIAVGSVIEVTEGVRESMISLGQAHDYTQPPAPEPIQDKKGAKK